MNLTRNPVFVSLLRWLASTEMFARPAKQLPGKWRLFEFYTEPEGQLKNLKEEAMKKKGYHWEIEFEGRGRFQYHLNLPIRLFNLAGFGTWHTSRNFIVLSPSENPGMTEEFQYAFENGNLKILKKEADGRILFFGFFRRLDVKDKL